MSKFSKRKIAVTMAFASLFGGKTSAAQTDKIPQSLVAVGGGRTPRNDQSVKQGLTKNRKLGITAAITTLVAVPVIAFTIWGIKRHSKSEQDQHEKNKNNNEKVDNNKNGENKNEKLLDSLIEFFSNGFDYVSINETKGNKVDITKEVREGCDKVFMVALGLLRCIKNNKLEINEFKKIDKKLTGFKCDYPNNDSIELIMCVDGAERKLTITKLNSNDNNLVNVYFRDTTIVLKAK